MPAGIVTSRRSPAAILGGVLPSDTGAASAAHSTAGQLGSSIGAALLSTIAATATVAYLAGATTPTATDHGYGVAMAWGVGILLVTAVPVAFLVNVRAPRRSRG
jgi:hypothetical protein